MDILQSPSKTESIRINRCRIFLQATTVSDITSADGTRITEYAWTPEQKQSITNPRRSKHDWPRQPRPGPKSWKAWKGAIQRHLSKKGKGQTLQIPLGPWTVSPSESRQHWEWYIDHDNSRIIHNTTMQATAYPLIGTGARQHHDTAQPETLTEIPSNAIPTAMGMNFTINRICRSSQRFSSYYTTVLQTT